MYHLIDKVKEINPLVLHYTNEVTINDCANITLALGASPLMSYSYEEVEEIVSIANSVVINMGTMNSNYLDLFIKAGKAANKYNKPVVLDPVGAFATKTRSDFINKLLNEVKFSVIKGNTAEIKYIGGFNVKGKGVDSLDHGENTEEIIKNVGRKLGCVVVATGKIDILSDGEKIIKIYNGTPKLKGISGTGCMTTSLIGSYLGCTDNSLEAAAMGVITMSLSGEIIDKEDIALGSFRIKLMDTVYKLTKEIIEHKGKVEMI